MIGLAFSRRILYAAGFLAVTVAGAIWWQVYRGETWEFVAEMLIKYAAMAGAVEGLHGGYERGRKWMKRRLGQ